MNDHNDHRYSSSPALIQTLVIAALACIIVTVLAFFYYQQRMADEWDKIAVEEAHHIQIQSSILAYDLKMIAHTRSFLHQEIHMHGFVEAEEERFHFSKDLLSFMSHGELFDQIRFLDARGMERVRVDYNQGAPVQVPESELQFKGDKYYVTATMKLSAGDIYISPMDLNMEQGKVERPYKPVMRFGIPLFDLKGNRLGMLMINHTVQGMLDQFSLVSTPSTANAMLLNADGYWLSHPDQTKEWGFMFEQGGDLNMAVTAPDIWKRVQAEDSGQFEMDGSMVSFTTVYPFEKFPAFGDITMSDHHKTLYWKVVSQFPSAEIKAQLEPARTRVMLFALFTLLMIALLTLLMLRAQQRKRIYEQKLHIRNRAIEDATAGIVICDMQQKDDPIIYCNAAFEAISGYARDEIIGLNCRFMQHNDRDQADMVQLRDAIAGREPCQVTLRNYRKDGSLFWNQLTTSPVYDPAGNVSHYLGYVVDITDHKQSDDEKTRLLLQVQELSRNLMQAREQERADIARSLHDDFAQMITAIQIQAEISEQKCKAGDITAAVQHIHKIEHITGQLLDTTRAVLKEVKLGHLEELGLIEAVKDMCEEWRHSTKIDADVAVFGAVDCLSNDIEIHLFRIVQEGLTNIVRHAAASHANITFRFGNGRLVLTIQDNGCGFNIQHTEPGNGLTGMRERIQSLGGWFEISCAPGAGTTLTCRLPLAQLKKNP